MSATFTLKYDALRGTRVWLEPITVGHTAGLADIGGHGGDWAYLPVAGLPNRQAAQTWVEQALELAARGEHFTYVLVDPGSGEVMGSSRYLQVRPAHRALEIGYSWLGACYQRTGVNTEAKLLLLRHAFEAMGANRVELKTDSRNKRSQRAIERLGATREGVLRSHMIAQYGHIRDTVMYSIIRPEWPAVRQRLEGMLSKGESIHV